MIKEIVKRMWQFARFLFVPQWGRSKSGNTEERIIKRDTFMNRRNVGIANYESLLEGCYHEMGHVLATLHFFPDEERVDSISFARKSREGFSFDTIYNKSHWSFNGQREALIMCCIGGGVFQQMKMKYGELKKHSEFNLCPVDVLRGYFSKFVKCPIEGMEVDMANLNNEYGKLLQHNTDLEPLNLEKEKEKAIDLFMPYLENKKIDKLCEHIVDDIFAKWGARDTIIGIKEIKAYLGL